MKERAEAKLAEVHDFEGQQGELVNAEKNAKREADAAKELLRAINAETEDLDTQAQMRRREIEAIDKQIHQANEMAKGRDGALEAVRNELQNAEIRLQTIKEEMANVSLLSSVLTMPETNRPLSVVKAQEEIPQVQAQLQELVAQIRDLESEEQSLRNQAERANRRIQDLQASVQDNMRPYGNNIQGVLAEIENLARQRRWTGQKPIGPLGKFVKLKVPEWSNVVEGNLGSNLNMFICENRVDADLLRSVLVKNRWCVSVWNRSAVVI
jgi:chromosome segregation ATPase